MKYRVNGYCITVEMNVCTGSVTNVMDDSILLYVLGSVAIIVSQRSLLDSLTQTLLSHCHPREHHDDDCDFFPWCGLPQFGWLKELYSLFLQQHKVRTERNTVGPTALTSTYYVIQPWRWCWRVNYYCKDNVNKMKRGR